MTRAAGGSTGREDDCIELARAVEGVGATPATRGVTAPDARGAGSPGAVTRAAGGSTGCEDDCIELAKAVEGVGVRVDGHDLEDETVDSRGW